MRKSILIFTIAILCASCIFAADMTAIASNGKTVILHDNGRWEYKSSNSSTKPYIGKWTFTTEMFDALVDSVLVESGVYSWSTEYAFYKAIYVELLQEELGDMNGLVLEFKENGILLVTLEGETTEGKYSINESTRLLTITADGETNPFGIFSADYSKLNILGMEAFFMSKLPN